MIEDLRNWTAGSLSGFTVRLLTQPFDVLKIRFQLQVEPIKRTPVSYYSGVWQALFRIVKEEGPTALWKGHIAGQLLSVTFCGIEFATFYGLSDMNLVVHRFQSPMSRDLVLGVLAGSAASLCCQPLDVMRTRLVAQGQHRIYGGLLSGLHSLVKTEGVLALWRGLCPSLILIAPQTSVTFAVYEKLKRSYVYFRTSQNSTVAHPEVPLPRLVSLYAGALAGLVGKTVVYPLDLTKKRLEIRGFEIARTPFGELPPRYTAASYKLHRPGRIRWNGYRTQIYATWACLKGVVVEEGPIGLFKGWVPSAMKAALSTGLMFFFFEQFRYFLDHCNEVFPH
ncbi:unnamed protein product [Calicophoron daubneyi]|uniref:Mitochondrial thiamine pyrophosphate carrier n=1 Tax=Calicophoron daubneyi TaxID=300641 RepID=A0AAV2TCT8_CALDB